MSSGEKVRMLETAIHVLGGRIVMPGDGKDDKTDWSSPDRSNMQKALSESKPNKQEEQSLVCSFPGVRLVDRPIPAGHAARYRGTPKSVVKTSIIYWRVTMTTLRRFRALPVAPTTSSARLIDRMREHYPDR